MVTTCINCQTAFEIRVREIKTTGNYCSKKCHYKSGATRPTRRTGQDIQCGVCGKTFYASLSFLKLGRKYCGLVCKGVASHNKPTITCQMCGKQFVHSLKGGNGEPRKYCSKTCTGTAKKEGEYKACAVCGKERYIPACRLVTTSMFFCGAEHANQWQGRNKTEHICKMCGKTFRWSLSRSKSGKYNVTYCSLACRDNDPKRAAMLFELNVLQQSLKPNKLELACYKLLDSMNIEYIPQHTIGGKFVVDAFVPSRGIVIQFDGDYWHGNPFLFPEPDERQRRRIALDHSQDNYMVVCGYRVLRIWQSELKTDQNAVMLAIQDALALPTQTRVPQL